MPELRRVMVLMGFLALEVEVGVNPQPVFQGEQVS